MGLSTGRSSEEFCCNRLTQKNAVRETSETTKMTTGQVLPAETSPARRGELLGVGVGHVTLFSETQVVQDLARWLGSFTFQGRPSFHDVQPPWVTGSVPESLVNNSNWSRVFWDKIGIK